MNKPCKRCGGTIRDAYGHCRACHRVSGDKYRRSAKGKASAREYMREFHHRADQKPKVKSRSIAVYARKSGKLQPKDCERCGSPAVEMHHADYSKPLQVVWLCNRCHNAEHGK